MRRASQNVSVMKDGGNILLSFGYDYCAEHEWGIKGIQAALGISGDSTDQTVNRFAVTKANANNVHLIEAQTTRGWASTKERRLYLVGGRIEFWKQTPEEFVASYNQSCPRSGEPEALWDERAFMFSVPAEHKDAEVLRKVHAALMENNALAYTASSGNPFGGSGLVIVRRSTIPKPLIDGMEEGFRDRRALTDAAEATGVRERVEEWGRKRGGFLGAFYALSPAWRRKGDKRNSAHRVIFWLNPTDQEHNNAGWFTVEELEQWMEGKGPIPTKAKHPA